MFVLLFIALSVAPSIIYVVKKPKKSEKDRVIYVGTAKFNEVK